MRIAIPTANGALCLHFGHCECFTLVDVDVENKKILNVSAIDAPEHQPGLFPPWLAQQGATVVIAGGMGGRAQDLFAQNNIQVITGASPEPVEAIAQAFLDGTLQTGANVCDH